MRKNSCIICIIFCFLLIPPIDAALIKYDSYQNNFEEDIENLAINILHPREKTIYFGWMDIYLGNKYPDWGYTVIVGKNIFKLVYGFIIVSDSNLSYIDVYVNEDLEMTLTEPTGYDGICQEWQMHWCPRGYNEIRLMAIDEYNNRFNAYLNLFVI